MSTLRVSLQAELDLDEIWLYIARDNLKAATKLRRDIEERFGMLSRQPLIGEEREDLAPGIRQFTVRQRVILYSYDAPSDTVQILRVLHGARDAASELRRSGLENP